MKRVLVPLDGTELSASILPDGRRLAGRDGELVLVRDTSSVRYNKRTGLYDGGSAGEVAEDYLNSVAETLREDGIQVRVQVLTQHDVAWAIDALAKLFKADMIACATHGRGPLGRLVRGSVAWRALAHSSVPVLLRHPEEGWERGLTVIEPPRRRILVPLDGSGFAERALPLAGELATDWSASIWLAQVVLDLQIPDTPYRRIDMLRSGMNGVLASTHAYLQEKAGELGDDVRTEVLVGPPVAGALVDIVRERSLTDVVMASHGRTGLSRVVLGSVADELIQHLHCPIIVVPMETAEATQQVESRRDKEAHNTYAIS